jgi:predicted kinase
MRFVVIAGPANTGKMPLARRLMQDDVGLTLVHRDFIRSSLERHIDEWHVTLLMADIVRRLLNLSHSAIVCAWNMEPADRALWTGIATENSVDLEWLDVRLPEVAMLIPPLVETAA